MTRLDLSTPDFTAANVERIAALFPNCVTETQRPDGTIRRAIDFDLLKQELSADVVDGPRERYRLDWPGKREALALANAPIRKTLRPCRAESIDFDTTEHLYIEGDNLDALKLLQETYLGKVKMIYIDPPYNTGNDFIYDDNFSMSREDYEALSGERDEEGRALFDEEKWRQNSSANGRFHSEWLSMMYPRLKLARNLLREDGVIFVSIDDGEVANLREICDEIFGGANFIGNIVWQSKDTPGNDSSSIAQTHNHILAFARSPQFVPRLLPRSDEQIATYKNPDSDPRGPWLATPLTRSEFRDRDYYALENKAGRKVFPPTGTCWRRPPEVLKELQRENRIWWGVDGDSEFPMEKKFLSEVKDGVVNQTWWPYKFAGSTRNANAEIKALFSNSRPFETPKPLQLLVRLINLSCSNESEIILDFFSGSATTAHAVMQLNAEDGGRRRHILVQLPEPCDEKSEAFKAGYATIAEIGKERIRRAGAKIRAELAAKLAATKEGSEEHQTLSDRLARLDTGFRVLKIDSSNLAEIQREPDQLDQGDLLLHVENIKPDRTPEDLLFQVLLDWGVDLSLKITKEIFKLRKDEGGMMNYEVFWVDDNALAACFETRVSADLVKEIAKRTPLRAVFRDAGYASDAVKINIEQIFKALSPHTELKTV